MSATHDHSELPHYGRRDFGRLTSLAAVAGGLVACSSAEEKTGSTDSTSVQSTAVTTTTGVPATVSLEDVGLPERGEGPLRVIIDTDAANEIDDQFALAWALMVPDQLQIEAITAAPFGYGNYMESILNAQELRGDGPQTPYEEIAKNLGSDGIAALMEFKTPEDGMVASFAEIEKFISAANVTNPPPALRGATTYLSSEDEPVDSEAAQAIIEAAHASDDPLYVAVLGAPTNVASALLLDPSIAEKIVVIFVAGYPSASREVDESFNLLQDRDASRVIFERSGPLVYIPGYQVSEVLSLSFPESERYLAGKGQLGEALHQLMASRMESDGPATPGNRWVMWDMAPIAWLLDPQRLVLSSPTSRGTINDEHRWESATGAMMESYRVDDKSVFIDFLSLFS